MGLFGDPLENCEPGNQWHGCPDCERLKAEISDLRKVVAEGQKRVSMSRKDYDRIAVTSRELNAEIAALREDQQRLQENVTHERLLWQQAQAEIGALREKLDNRFKCQGCGAEFPLIRGNIKTLERAKIEGEGVTHCSQCVENEILAGTVKELKAEIAALREKLVQIHICAENARWGRLNTNEALDSIMKAAANEYVEGK